MAPKALRGGPSKNIAAALGVTTYKAVKPQDAVQQVGKELQIPGSFWPTCDDEDRREYGDDDAVSELQRHTAENLPLRAVRGGGARPLAGEAWQGE